MISYASGAALVAAVGAAGAAGVTGAAAAAGARHHVMCMVELHSVGAPDSLTGEDFGTADCSAPFGKGVVHDTFTVTPTSRTTGTVDGRFKEFYDEGTISGTFKLTYTVENGVVSSTGTAKISSGTGAYEKVKGSGDVRCHSTSPTTMSCEEPRTVKLP